MSVGESDKSGSVDPYSFGIIVGQLRGIEKGISELKESIKEQPTRRELEKLEERVEKLENAPAKNTSRRLSILAVVISGVTGIAGIASVLVASFHQ